MFGHLEVVYRKVYVFSEVGNNGVTEVLKRLAHFATQKLLVYFFPVVEPHEKAVDSSARICLFHPVGLLRLNPVDHLKETNRLPMPLGQGEGIG